MDSGLVDLSLFAYSPTVDKHFSNINRTDRHNLYSSATWPAGTPTRTQLPQEISNKPLPKRPRRKAYDFCMPLTGSRCVLRRIRRVKLDSIRGDYRQKLQSKTPSAYAAAPSAYVNPNSIPERPASTPTIRKRRNLMDPQLALSNDITRDRNSPAMVWLEDEQMWLIADPTDSNYGYYATGPEDGIDWLPPYTESGSPASEVSQSDLSPIREQFMSLIDGFQRNRTPRTQNPDEPQMLPLFQEALAGVGMLDIGTSSDYSVQSTRNERKPAHVHTKAYGDSPSYERSRHASNNQISNLRPSSSQLFKHDSRPSTPRSESQALRAGAGDHAPSKFLTEGELQRQRERVNRRRMISDSQNISSPSYYGNLPYGHNTSYHPSCLSGRDSWHSDNASISPIVSPETAWPIRSSSARH